MYRENSFEVMKNKHDKFNFSKVLQKRKEFYKYHLPGNSEEAVQEMANRKLAYCNDNFIQNLSDKRLVEEITGGEPTYENQRLYHNIRQNNQMMIRNPNLGNYSETHSDKPTYSSLGTTTDNSRINI